MEEKNRITIKNSPNKMSRNGCKPDTIVNHIAEGSYNGTITWLCNPKSQVSAHFVISKKGEITQLIDIREAAWANGTSTKLVNNSYYGNSVLKHVLERKTNANYYSISIEHEGFSDQGQGKLTPEQFKATVWLHKHIIKEVKKIYGISIPLDREHIVGHYQITPLSNPNCPGSAFQWNELMNELVGGLKDWQREMGLESIKNLSNRCIEGEIILNSPEQWKNSLAESVPQWLFWAIIDRITQ